MENVFFIFLYDYGWNIFFSRAKYLATDTPETHVGFNVTCPFWYPGLKKTGLWGGIAVNSYIQRFWLCSEHTKMKRLSPLKRQRDMKRSTLKNRRRLTRLPYQETEQHRLLTPWSQVCLWKITINQEVKEFPARDGEETFSTMFTQNPEIVEWSSINWYVYNSQMLIIID